FSSRRRHTRLVSDWSSDVCSSDLGSKTELSLPKAVDGKASIAWIGRPAVHGGEEVTRLAWFVEAAAALGDRARVTLAGERLQGGIGRAAGRGGGEEGGGGGWLK